MDLTDSNFLGSADFFKAADITQAGGQLSLVIGGVGMKEFTNDKGVQEKLTLEFAGQDKAVVLNITNTRALASMFGNETNGWPGKQILLTVRQTEMGPGVMVTPIMPPPATLGQVNQPHHLQQPSQVAGSGQPGAPVSMNDLESDIPY